MDECDASGSLPIYSEFKMNLQECARWSQGLKLYQRFSESALTNPNIMYNSGFLWLKVWHIVFLLKDKQEKKVLLRGEGGLRTKAAL